jgi:DNA-directed RNA polymerase subunit RPC12/RpoP
MARQRQASFERMEASLLACPKCRRAVQVRKRLLLILPEGDKYEYVCPHCGSTCGDTIEKPAPPLKFN